MENAICVVDDNDKSIMQAVLYYATCESRNHSEDDAVAGMD